MIMIIIIIMIIISIILIMIRQVHNRTTAGAIAQEAGRVQSLD